MASRTRSGKKNRVVATPCELTTEVPSSKASCKGSLSMTNRQAKISTTSFQTTNDQAPTPLPQPLHVSAPLSQAPSQRISPHATTLAPQTTCNSADSDHSLKRKGRGPTRGKGTDNIVAAAGKISLDISKKSGRAIGNQQARLASECGYIVRSFAPLRYKRWIDIPKDEKNTLYDRVLENVEVTLEDLDMVPKPASSHGTIDLTATDTESIALREKIEKQEQELVDVRAKLSQFEILMQTIISGQVGTSSQPSMPSPTDLI
ncbi:Uncharacterized protein Adt_23125 [Abeliophyllum distichum]|uniref:Uncharacterized protein n=1 Tax=Abeliophyllum distichum TaxID=126358 RepID=A0ABD1SA20_9LAMI